MEKRALSTAKSNNLKKAIAKIVTSPNLSGDDLVDPHKVFKKLERVATLGELLAEYVGAEFKMQSRGVEFVFVVPKPVNALSPQYMESAYDRTTNVVRLDLLRMAYMPWHEIYHELLHELKHKCQLDGEGGREQINMYSIYAVNNYKDRNMLWHLDENEQDAEKYAIKSGKKILKSAGVRYFVSPRAYNYIYKTSLEGIYGTLKSKLRFKLRKSKLQESDIAGECLAVFNSVTSFFKDYNNTLLVKNCHGTQYNIPIKKLAGCLKNATTEQEFLKNYTELVSGLGSTTLEVEHNNELCLFSSISMLELNETKLLYYLYKQKDAITASNYPYILTNVFFNAFGAEQEAEFASLSGEDIKELLNEYKWNQNYSGAGDERDLCYYSIKKVSTMLLNKKLEKFKTIKEEQEER